MTSKEDYYAYIYNRLIVIFPDAPWRRVIGNLNRNKKSTVKQFSDYLIPYGIELWESREGKEYDSYLTAVIADAMFYCGKILELFDFIEEKHLDRLKSRFFAAFRQPNDMRSLTFEVFVFFALRDYGYVVESKDDDGAGETYDYLIGKNSKFIQVECKSFAYDKGLAINGDEAQSLIEKILENGLEINSSPTGEIGLMTLEIIAPIPSTPRERNKFICELLREINEKSYRSTDKFKFHFQQHKNVKNIDEVDACLGVLNLNKHGVDLGLTVTSPDGDKSRHGLQITTRAKDGFWREFEKICKDAAKRQLRKNKPASIVVHVSNIQTVDNFSKDERFAQKLKNIFFQDHIVSIVIISNISVDTQEEYPFFYVTPIIYECVNEKSKYYPEIGKVFQK